jgi:hypothetical protein
MRLTELQEELKLFGLPLAYQEFSEGDAPDLPYMVFLDHTRESPSRGEASDAQDMKADNKTWLRSRRVYAELYTPAAPSAALDGIRLAEDFEDFMTGKGLLWNYEYKVRVPGQGMYMTVWTINIVF